jgi:argininosuccinate lyase
MSDRENAHHLIDTLPEDQLADVLDYLAELRETGEITAETKTAIEEGLDDIRNGRTVSLEEFRQTRGL